MQDHQEQDLDSTGEREEAGGHEAEDRCGIGHPIAALDVAQRPEHQDRRDDESYQLSDDGCSEDEPVEAVPETEHSF